MRINRVAPRDATVLSIFLHFAYTCLCGEPHNRGFCPSCQARRAEEWALWLIDHRLEQVPHHHVIFTIPKMLRAYFRYDRSLLNDLSRAANRTVLNYLRILLGTDVTPGLVVARHTFGEGARFHPHLHAIVAGGGWDTDHNWHAVFGWDRPTLRELFQIEVFRFLRERELLDTERIELIRSWRHSGFDVYVGGSIEPNNRELLEHIARYLLRAPVSLERMWYNPEAGTVKIRPLAGEGNTQVELEALEFISRLVLHIPDVRERQVTYYGVYANASRHRRQKRMSTGPDAGFVPLSELEEPTPFELQRRIRWAQLIKKVWLEDPLLCPECGGEMRIISFITDPPVVDKILRHIQWHPGEPLVPYVRPPPVLMVAESPA